MSRSLNFSSILRARCPACNEGKLLEGVFKIRPRCRTCDLNFYPESGFYLGAMFIGYLATAALTIPPTVALKFLGAPTAVLVAFPFCEFVFVGTFLLFYSRILWLHLEYRMTNRLDGKVSERRPRD